MLVKYDDSGVEPSIPKEDELTNEIITLINRIQTHNFSLHRHGFRGTHVKVQGIVKGHMTVLPHLPAELSQGVFSSSAGSSDESLKYDIAIRYANEPSFLQDDRAPGPRGCSMKVFLPNSDPSSNTTTTSQDFTFNNAPILELTDLPTTVEIFHIRERHFFEPDKIPDVLKRDRNDTDLQMAPFELPNKHFLSYTMYSQSAYRYGPYVVKYALFPTSPPHTSAPTSDSGSELESGTGSDSGSITSSSLPDQHSQWLKSHFSHHEMTYDFRVQLCESLEDQPVENASVAWDEEKYPYRTVAKVVLPPRQNSADPVRWRVWDERVKINVWANARDEHKPLGSVNRLRRRLYEESKKRREELNGLAGERRVTVVTNIDDIP